MNLSPFPRPDDVVFIQEHVVNVITVSDAKYPMSVFSASFQGNDRPALTAYGVDVGQAVACLYNTLVVEYELEEEG